jgi:hypothetical protein
MMYTIQFGARAHFLSDEAAAAVHEAMENHRPFVTVPIDLSGDDIGPYDVTLNVSHVVALIRHRESASVIAQGAPARDGRRLVLVG